ncbi:mechanosensitive ion channel family protein [Allopontixanthobacter sp.]|uniref:mechanosensitive ion channel family protein n=1 Tax=Allopontixanthobacter sp. TaxID=2906452 RepID=UPI002ABB6D7C|nr:mechanosensitive ion channel family protein [Allopontixanthobacter sp.]MDZ4307143.1 mechanosensitive ion channel family protein [Allopontixanthobacter sp.]
MLRTAMALVLLLAPAVTAPAAALIPGAAESPAPAAAPEPQIASTAEAGSDERIAARITDIFSQLPSLSQIRVSVSEGVVTLTGSAADSEAIERAETIASRVDGVVTVENDLERDVSVDSNLGALGNLSDRFDGFVAMLPLIGAAAAVALVIGLIGYLIAGIGSLWRRIAPNSFLAELIATAIRFVFVVGGLVIALDMIGAGALLGAVLGGAGLVGVALGFAMRETIENYVASLMLSLRQPFRANDHVVIDDLEGRVIRLTSRATILMTMDGNHLRIPNSTVFKAVILNYTRNPQRRFEFELGIDAADDAGEARRLGVEVLSHLSFVLGDPPPFAAVEQVGDSNIVIRFFAWIDQQKTDFLKARSEAIPAVKDALEEAGFALPEPIYRLRFDAGTPLPIGSAQITEASEPRRTTGPGRKKIPLAKDAAEQSRADVAPDHDVEQMVDAERSSATTDQDLLDSSRPVE